MLSRISPSVPQTIWLSYRLFKFLTDRQSMTDLQINLIIQTITPNHHKCIMKILVLFKDVKIVWLRTIAFHVKWKCKSLKLKFFLFQQTEKLTKDELQLSVKVKILSYLALFGRMTSRSTSTKASTIISEGRISFRRTYIQSQDNTKLSTNPLLPLLRRLRWIYEKFVMLETI